MKAIFKVSDIRAVATCASKDRNYAILMGIYLEAGRNSYRITATDQYRLATVSRSCESENEPGTAIIPAKALIDMLKAADTFIEITADETTANARVFSNVRELSKAGAPRVSFTLDLIEGTYPKTEKLTEGAKITESAAPYIHLSPDYLADMAKAANIFRKGGPLAMSTSEALKPAFFTSEDETGRFLGLIMGIRFDAPRMVDLYEAEPEAEPEPEKAPEQKPEAPKRRNARMLRASRAAKLAS